jgi:hypothetical protein
LDDTSFGLASHLKSGDDVRALADFKEAITQAQTLDRNKVRNRAAEQFDIVRIVESIINAVNMVRLAGKSARL